MTSGFSVSVRFKTKVNNLLITLIKVSVVSVSSFSGVLAVIN